MEILHLLETESNGRRQLALVRPNPFKKDNFGKCQAPASGITAKPMSSLEVVR